MYFRTQEFVRAKKKQSRKMCELNLFIFFLFVCSFWKYRLIFSFTLVKLNGLNWFESFFFLRIETMFMSPLSVVIKNIVESIRRSEAELNDPWAFLDLIYVRSRILWFVNFLEFVLLKTKWWNGKLWRLVVSFSE